MSDRTAISWTDATWNPVTGCTKVSPGCAHCYAEAITLRFKRGGPYLPGKTTIRLHPDRLDQPLRWRRPRRIFVCSMSDLFHEDVPLSFLSRVWGIMRETPRHTYQMLTKRPERMLEWLKTLDTMRRGVCAPPESEIPFTEWFLNTYPNIWLGVSVENQYWADRRIPLLLQTPAAVRFLSLEPLLKRLFLKHEWLTGRMKPVSMSGAYTGFPPGRTIGGGEHVNQVIIGGESGPGHRPMDPAWVEDIAGQCRAAGVPVFVKQDSGARPGQQGRLSDDLWGLKEFPHAAIP
jgi:protein gp37